MRYEGFKEFLDPPSRPKPKAKATAAELPKTPEESLELIVEELKKGLAQELLERIKECTPDFFEQLVVDLLVKMG